MFFYEQDIVMLDYVYTGNIKVSMGIDYQYPGIGIIIAAKKDDIPENTNNAYLLKIGINDFAVINKKLLTQSKMAHGSCPFAPLDVSSSRTIEFHKDGKTLSLTTIINKKTITLGLYTLPEDVNEYRLGFYSNKGNTIQTAIIHSSRPQYWFSNTRNTNGGRISFKKDTFVIEQAELPIELEQEKIHLAKGKYFLDFEKQPVNNKKDINCYVFDSSEKRINAKTKNLLQADNSFVIEKDMDVNILFQGTSGAISKICIKDDDQQSYISTDEQTVEKAGSKVIVHLERLKEVRWVGQVDAYPDYSLNQDVPYSIMTYQKIKSTVENLGLLTKHEYSFAFSLSGDGTIWILSVKTKTGETIHTASFTNNGGAMEIFDNVSGTISELIVVTAAGDEINVLAQKTYKKYVPSTIESPILVVDENDTPFDLSSAYRYIEETDSFIFTNWERETFVPEKQIILENKINDSINAIVVYGVKNDDYCMDKLYTITQKEPVTSINQFSGSYDAISTELYSITDSKVLDFEDGIVSKYRLLVVDYLKDDSYCINLTEDRKQYEVDISSSKEKIETLYDMTPDGQVRKYKILDDIVPMNDNYIVLKKEEDTK